MIQTAAVLPRTKTYFDNIDIDWSQIFRNNIFGILYYKG